MHVDLKGATLVDETTGHLHSNIAAKANDVIALEVHLRLRQRHSSRQTDELVEQ